MFHLKRKGLFTASMIALMLLALVPTQWAKAGTTSIYGITPATGTVGTGTAFTITYTVDTTQQTWAVGDTLIIALPANFPAWSGVTISEVEVDGDVTNNSTNETAITAGAGNGQYVLDASNMTIKWGVVENNWVVVDEATTIRVVATINPTYLAASSVITFTGATAAEDTNPSNNTTAVVNVSAAAAAGSLALGGNSIVGATGDSTLTFTVPTGVTIAANGTIAFTAPANLDVSSVGYSSDTFGVGGNFTAGTGCAPSSQTITCTVKAEKSLTAGTGTIVLSGIKSIYVAASQTISTVAVKDASGNTTATTATGSLTNTTVGAVSSAIGKPVFNLRGNSGAMTIGFTTHAAIPADGKIKLTFPSMYDVSGLAATTASSLSGLDATWTATVSGQVVTLAHTVGDITAAGAKSLVLTPIVNNTAGIGQILFLTTYNNGTTNIETGYSSMMEVLTPSVGAVNPNTGPATGVAPAPATPATPAIPATPATPATPAIPATPATPAAKVTTQDLLTKPSFNVEQAKALATTISADKALVAPTSGTPNCTPNSLIKGTTNKTVYYCGQNGKRFVFPNEKTYKTWFVDFSNVQTLSDTALSQITLGGNATYKPGAKLIKIQTDPKVYAVAPGGVLRWIGSEVLAAKYYGTKWNKQIDDVSDAFFTNYTIGTPITE